MADTRLDAEATPVTLAFRGLVYPQIWEDPAVDLEAMQIRPTDHVLAIGSGGCNILNYLVADPARISAIDLNGAHIALIRLKLCALRHLPDYDSFFRFFGSADCRGNLVAYDPSDGKPLWHTHLGQVSNAVETYMLDGRQYILVSSGDTLYAFALNF